MSEYKEPYFYLFNKLSDLSEEIKTIQVHAEERYVSSTSDNTDKPLPAPKTKENT